MTTLFTATCNTAVFALSSESKYPIVPLVLLTVYAHDTDACTELLKIITYAGSIMPLIWILGLGTRSGLKCSVKDGLTLGC